MNAWGSEPQEVAMGRLIHDFNQRMFGVRQSIKELESGERTPQQIAATLRATEGLLKRTIDEYYTEFKNDFKPAQ